jgi:hypothetical protein
VHAVHVRYSIQECPDGMLNVFMHMARSTDVLYQVDPVWFKRTIDSFEHPEWPGLIMDSIERRDAVECFRFCSFVKVAEINGNKPGVLGFPCPGSTPPGAQTQSPPEPNPCL